MKNTSIFKGVVEFSSDGTDYRFLHQGSTWGAYTRTGNSYIRRATIRAPRNATPAVLLRSYLTLFDQIDHSLLTPVELRRLS